MPIERRILIWMCVLVAINQLGFGAMVPVLPLYAQSFGVSASAIGMAVAVYGLARVLLAVPAGQIADRLGRRPALALGGLVSAIGNLWCAYAGDYPEFVLARFVAGAGAGLILTSGQVVLADISTPARRGRNMATYQGVFIFAVGIGPLPGGLLAAHFGLAAPFAAFGAASAIAALVAWFAVQETRDFSDGESKVIESNRPRAVRPPLLQQLHRLAQQRGFVLVSLISFMNAVARTGAIFAIVPVLGAEKLGLSPTAIGLAMAMGSVCGLLVAYPAGALVDRLGRKAVIVPATVLAGTSLALFCIAPSYAWFIAATLVWGIAISVGGAAPAAYAADSAAPGMNAAAMSSFRMLGDLGYVIGPIALGLVVDLFGATAALLLAAGLLVLVGSLFGWLAPETHRPKPAPAAEKS